MASMKSKKGISWVILISILIGFTFLGCGESVETAEDATAYILEEILKETPDEEQIRSYMNEYGLNYDSLLQKACIDNNFPGVEKVLTYTFSVSVPEVATESELDGDLLFTALNDGNLELAKRLIESGRKEFFTNSELIYFALIEKEDKAPFDYFLSVFEPHFEEYDVDVAAMFERAYETAYVPAVEILLSYDFPLEVEWTEKEEDAETDYLYKAYKEDKIALAGALLSSGRQEFIKNYKPVISLLIREKGEDVFFEYYNAQEEHRKSNPGADILYQHISFTWALFHNKEFVSDILETMEDEALKYYSHELKDDPLSYVAHKGDTALLKKMLEREFSQYTIDKSLHSAGKGGNIEAIQLMLDAGADVNYDLDRKNTAINAAVKNSHFEAVQFLYDSGAVLTDYDIKDAAKSDNLEMLVYIIEKIEVEESIHDELLIAAAQSANQEVLNYVLENYPLTDDVVKYQHWAVTKAAEAGLLENIKILLTAFPDIDPADWNPRIADIPIIKASRNGHVEVVEYLLSMGADINLVRSFSSDSVAIEAAVLGGQTEIVRLLLKQQPELRKSLHHAVKKGFIDIVELLLENGADPNNKFDYKYDDITSKYSPLLLAIREKNVDIVSRLLKAGAKTESNMIDVLYYGGSEVFESIIEHTTAELEAETLWGVITYSELNTERKIELLKKCIEKGADPNEILPIHQGKFSYEELSSLDLALKRSTEEALKIVDFLCGSCNPLTIQNALFKAIEHSGGSLFWEKPIPVAPVLEVLIDNGADITATYTVSTNGNLQLNILEYMFHTLDHRYIYGNILSSLNRKNNEILYPSGYIRTYPEVDPGWYLYKEYYFIKETAEFFFSKGIGKTMYAGFPGEVSFDTVMSQYNNWLYEQGYKK